MAERLFHNMKHATDEYNEELAEARSTVFIIWWIIFMIPCSTLVNVKILTSCAFYLIIEYDFYSDVYFNYCKIFNSSSKFKIDNISVQV